MAIPPEKYNETGPYELLSEAARGHIAFDRRLLAVLHADPARTLPDLVRFSRRDLAQDRIDLGLDLLHLFKTMPTPEAVPFIVGELRRFPEDAPLELLQLAARLGEPLVNPLLDLFEETGRQHSEIVFVAITAGARGPRLESAIAALAESDAEEAAFLGTLTGTSYAPDASSGDDDEDGEALEYPAEASPDLSILNEDERREFLESPSSELRAAALAFYAADDLPEDLEERILVFAQTDSDAIVRGLAWEALRASASRQDVRDAMTKRLAEVTDPDERASLACALADYPETPGFNEAILASYELPQARARALEAMWQSQDRRWVKYPGLHLDDADSEVARQAILGVGNFRLHGEASRLEDRFDDADLREDALFAYILAAPGESSPFGLRTLEKRVAEMAGGLNEDEEALVKEALDVRRVLAGHRTPELRAAPPAASTRVGRNDPCPCGSGKKFKKCCGSAA